MKINKNNIVLSFKVLILQRLRELTISIGIRYFYNHTYFSVIEIS